MVSEKKMKEYIYSHIGREYEMGLPPQESWEGIESGDEDWVDDCIGSGFSLEDMKGKYFEEVLDKWYKDNPDHNEDGGIVD